MQKYELPLSDDEIEFLDSNPDWIRSRNECPTCHGTGSYRYQGVEYNCDLDAADRHVQRQLFKRYCLANIPHEFQVLSIDDFPDEGVRDRLKDYIDRFDKIRWTGFGYEIMGRSKGVGKTYAATSILKSVVNAGYTGFFYWFNDALSLYERDFQERDLIGKKLRESELLVLDEVLEPTASESQRAYYENRLEDILRYRTSYNFPTIITTNLMPEDIEQYYPRCYSLLSAKQYRLELSGDDYRRKAWEKKAEYLYNDESQPII